MNPFFTRGRTSLRDSPSPPESPQLVPPSQPNPQSTGNVIRIMSPAGERLSIIMENGNLAPPKIPPKSPNRYRSSSRGSISVATVVSTGPALSMAPTEKVRNWSIWSDDGRDESQPPPGLFARFQDNRHITRRGGWKRLSLCVLLFLVVIAAIVIGVLLGTRRNGQNK